MRIDLPCPCSRCRRPVPTIAITKALTIILTVIPALWLLIGGFLSLGA